MSTTERPQHQDAAPGAGDRLTLRPSELERVADYIRVLGKPTVAELMSQASEAQQMLIQPRCGVGSHEKMKHLLQSLEAAACPDILTLTIDSYTRLGLFDEARNVLAERPDDLNGYPFVAHGSARGRELNESVKAPIQIRHGSPDARRLFAVSLESGITSFEGGGISYNVPYCKKIPIRESLEAWRDIDRTCGEAAEHGIIIDRELFGTLTAVLVPPSLALAIITLEAMLAADNGVRCVSMAISQTGNFIQDVAALHAIPILAKRYLPNGIQVYAVFHEFMGPFPALRREADALILYGALTARCGGAVKLINKTYQEAYGIPSLKANELGIHTARMATSWILDFLKPETSKVEEELELILAEISDILAPVLQGSDLFESVVGAFERGYLDVPFSPNIHIKSDVLPMRDSGGAIRYYDAAGLQLRPKIRCLNRAKIELASCDAGTGLFDRMLTDIEYFSRPRASVDREGGSDSERIFSKQNR